VANMTLADFLQAALIATAIVLSINLVMPP
jgi:hypothetical protein